MRAISPIRFTSKYYQATYSRHYSQTKDEPQARTQEISFRGFEKTLSINKLNPLKDKVPFSSLPESILSKDKKLNILNDEIKKILSTPIAKAETKIEKIKCVNNDYFENKTTFYYDKNDKMVCKNQGTGFIFYYNKNNDKNTFVSINENTGELVRAYLELYKDNKITDRISYDIFNGFQLK